jgi:N-acetylglucosaminyldiphosphoundecaprenol N-acetyl-beta-D-mannosaminyltransferase
MVEVLGIPLYDRDIDTAVEEILRSLKGPFVEGNRRISATGAHGLVEARDNELFRQALLSCFINLPDGMPAVWVGRWKGAKQMQRCYGPDFFKTMMQASAKMSVKHFLCGGKEGVARQLQQNCERRFGNQQVTGIYCPPFREMSEAEMQELGQRILDSGAHIVWVGLSTPKQELFAQRLSAYLQNVYLITVGAAFDFHTDQVKQAPRWVQKAGLEWFFRLLMEPKRLYKRYFKVVPLFIWLNMKEFLDIYIYKKKRV